MKKRRTKAGGRKAPIKVRQSRRQKSSSSSSSLVVRVQSRAPVDLAFSWFADLTEGDHNGPSFTAKRRPGTVSYREILSVARETAIVKDVWGKETIYQLARFFPGDRIEYEWSEKPEKYRPWTTWRFEPGPDGEGCVITVEFSPGVSPGIARSSMDRVRIDAERHAKEMEDDVRAHPPAARPDVVVRRK